MEEMVGWWLQDSKGYYLNAERDTPGQKTQLLMMTENEDTKEITGLREDTAKGRREEKR